MDDKDFIKFISTATSRGGCTFNLKTKNCSKQARAILATTPYKSLAKPAISAKVARAYYNNSNFKEKITQVMEELGITVIE